MKIILGICLLIFSFQSFSETNDALRRSNSLLRFIAKREGLRDFALSTAIGFRCDRYATDFKYQCNNTVEQMIKILDYTILLSKDNVPELVSSDIPESFVFVAFKTNFISLLSDSSTEKYLQGLQESLSEYAYTHDESKAINIWDYSVKFYGSEALAAKALSALFQDTSRMKLHLAYLEKAKIEGNAHFTHNKEKLSHVIDTINMILDYNEDDFGKIFYPKELQVELNRSIYHFYVPLYLSNTLESITKSKILAMTAPLMLTLTYEFVTSANDYTYVIKDPENITDVWKLRDIYGGYMGGMFGVQVASKARSFTYMQMSFEESTKLGVQNLLRYSVTP